MTHVCSCKLNIVGSDKGLVPGWHQAIIWTYAEIFFIGLLGTNFSENLIKVHTFSLKKMHLKTSQGKCWPFWLGLNMLRENKVNSEVRLPFRQPDAWRCWTCNMPYLFFKYHYNTTKVLFISWLLVHSLEPSSIAFTHWNVLSMLLCCIALTYLCGIGLFLDTCRFIHMGMNVI